MQLRLLLIFLLSLIVALVPASQGQSFQVLHNFGASGDGTLPSGSLVMDNQGHLYGVTIDGGTGSCSDYGCGTVYQLTRVDGEWYETILHSFDFNTEGAQPYGPLAIDDAGDLYGPTSDGGPGGIGSAFELSSTENGWELSLIYDSGSKEGFISNGHDIYADLGPGSHLAGAIAELSPSQNGWIYSQLYSFCSLPKCVDGYDVKWPLTLDAKGNIYGATYFGGNGYGLAFELSHNRVSSSISGPWTYHIMHRFASFPTDGGYPGSGLVLDQLGNAYGVSYNGGANGNGAVYKLTPFLAVPWVWTETQIYNFPADLQNGGFPVGNLVFDQAGNLYGSAGGGTGCNPYGCGVIFKLTPGANGQWSYSVVHYFNGEDGFGPNPLAVDQNGNLFGTTQVGGTYNYGVAFEIMP